jgi:hypothetical protein
MTKLRQPKHIHPSHRPHALALHRGLSNAHIADSLFAEAAALSPAQILRLMEYIDSRLHEQLKLATPGGNGGGGCLDF